MQVSSCVTVFVRSQWPLTARFHKGQRQLAVEAYKASVHNGTTSRTPTCESESSQVPLPFSLPFSAQWFLTLPWVSAWCWVTWAEKHSAHVSQPGLRNISLVKNYWAENRRGWERWHSRQLGFRHSQHGLFCGSTWCELALRALFWNSDYHHISLSLAVHIHLEYCIKRVLC